MKNIMPLAFAAILAPLFAAFAQTGEVQRFRLEAGSPYANQFFESVVLPGGAETQLLSGMTPPVIDATVPDDTVAAYGDTDPQTRNILRDVQAVLERRGYTMREVVKMQAFLVADPRNANGRADFRAFARAYSEFFGNAGNPDIPVRTRTQVVGLVWPGWLVEIEVMAARAR